MGSFTDKDNKTDTIGSATVPASHVPDAGRRRFSRSALAGSAVLLSLGNRAAWGAQQPMACMSVATLNSFNPSTGHFVSAPAGRPEHNEELAAKIHSISQSSPDYLGTDGKYSTCQKTALDDICVIKGERKDCP